ncbi:L-aminoadipate-semialdehyde dehydrogenase [Thozetella sp. PMI_491]|nr:L-aminoadipate-semialdehyde dehydrogenase [Thozetella sp. PMI_491]
MAVSQGHGERLLPNIIDELAQEDPGHILYAFPRGGKLENGFRDVSAKELANAINRTAWWLESLMGRSTSFETLAYIGPRESPFPHVTLYAADPLSQDDIRYGIITIAAVKAGFQALFLSPRNSIAGQIGLMQTTKCTTIVLPTQRHESVSSILEAGAGWLKVLDIPELEDLLLVDPVEPYPYNKTWEQARSEVLFVTHTSGTTGVPKPVVCRHGLAASWDASNGLPNGSDGTPVRHRFREGQVMFCTFPFYHMMGAMNGLWSMIFYKGTHVMGPPIGIPSLSLAEQVLDLRKIDAWVLPPPVVEELGLKPAVLERFRGSEFIVTGGGPVSHDLGVAVAKVIKLRNMIGASETLLLQCWDILDPNDWHYFRWHPSMQVDMREVAPGIFECWVLRKREYERYQGVFHTFPELQEYNFRDVYSRHPDPKKSDYWYSVGRSDDIIVLGNGEKIQPADIESIINSHPDVMGSLLVAPAQAQIHRNYILFAEKGKHLLRADKGSVKRLSTVALFQEDIDRFYQKREDEYADSALSGVDAGSLESIQGGIRALVGRILSVPAEKVSLGDDLFGAGLDSLQVFIVVGALRGALRQRAVSDTLIHKVRPQIVYANPTIEKLSKAFRRVLSETSSNDILTNGHGPAGPAAEDLNVAEALLEKYTANICSTVREDGLHVVLTGSTGSLGSYILDELLSRPNVRSVTCLNRSADGKKKQLASSASRGLGLGLSDGRVQFLQADLSKVDFGLPGEAFRNLLDKTTLVIHNAWPVNFNWGLASFEPHIAGVRNLVEFALNSRCRASIFFISSIGATMGLDTDGKVPEAVIRDLSYGTESGYAGSKLVSELILERAAREAGVTATIFRIGQIGGPVLRAEKGEWNKQEWLPTLIATSKRMGVLPSTLGCMESVDWIPVDLVAQIVLELCGIAPAVRGPAGAERGLRIYHGVNPRTTSWSSLAPVALEHLGPSVKLASWEEWLTALRNEQQELTSAAAHEVTGLKLADFFESLGGTKRPAIATVMSEEASSVLRQLKAVDAEWLRLWLRQWGL